MLKTEYYIIYDGVASRPYFAFKKDGEFWSESYYEYKIDKPIIYYVKLELPTKQNLNGWKSYLDELPETENIYTPSEAVLTCDNVSGTLFESNWYPIEMIWIDEESDAPYNDSYKPTHWKKIPTIEEMRILCMK